MKNVPLCDSRFTVTVELIEPSLVKKPVPDIANWKTKVCSFAHRISKRSDIIENQGYLTGLQIRHLNRRYNEFPVFNKSVR